MFFFPFFTHKGGDMCRTRAMRQDNSNVVMKNMKGYLTSVRVLLRTQFATTVTFMRHGKSLSFKYRAMSKLTKLG